MGRIRILSDQVANKIAAGEVVERPASVVKELLENSLDAGSTTIRVEAVSGGRRLIRITDDGCGMLRDDAMLAFERHSTSKLTDVKDLLSIATLGFRGEALPSIASVSRLTLETRSRDESTGTRIEIAGGKMMACQEAALASGTIITVRDLFFNVPARKKFLRSETTELAHIATLATEYSLAHPDKNFTLIHDEKELLAVTPAADLRDRIYQVFGGQLLEELIPLAPVERALPPEPGSDSPAGTLQLTGFVSRPQFQKSNRNSIHLFVNGRVIRDRLLLHALNSAYYNLVPSGVYPFAMLFLSCDYEEVDVNVHPSKTEVRFRHGPVVHDFVRDAVRNSLIAAKPAPSLPSSRVSQPAAHLPYSEFSQQIEEQRFESVPAPAPDSELPVFNLHGATPAVPRLDFGQTPGIPGEPVRFSAPPPAPPPASPQLKLRIPESHSALPPDAAYVPGASLSELANLRPLGQIHDSFIVAAGRDGLWLIDQHVAHERILFEKVLRGRAEGKIEVQALLMPMIIELTPAQMADYNRIAAELNATGFETEPFGPRSIAIKAAPSAVPPGEIDKLVFEILEIADAELRGVSLEDLRRGIAASVACRAAIKINTPLDERKMAWLLEELAATQCPMSCPHGRPIALLYSTRDILKGFHRV
ncbi:MAG: DNA mismatch repair endonuclease MutL [Bryobacteraceae bacterium]